MALVSNCCAEPEFPWTKITGVGGSPLGAAAALDAKPSDKTAAIRAATRANNT